MSHLTRYYVSYVFSQDYMVPFCDDSLYECVQNTCEHASLCGIVSDHAVTFSLAVISTVFCPFLNTLSLITLLFFLFGFPFLPCSMYLHCSSLLVGLVFPTFSLYGTRRGGRLERNVRQWSRVERKEEEMDAKQAERRRKRGSQDGPRAGKRGAHLAS